MGLTFNYDLRLPASRTADEVNDILEKLKRRAEQLRFIHISATYEGVVEFLPDEWRHVFNVFTEVNAEVVRGDERSFVADTSSARGFLASPGKGAESTGFAFMLRTFDDDGSREWWWPWWLPWLVDCMTCRSRWRRRSSSIRTSRDWRDNRTSETPVGFPSRV